MKTSKCLCGENFEQKSLGRPRKYCSNKCRNCFSRAQILYICKNCEVAFFDRKRKRKVQFCSNSCHYKYIKYSKNEMIKHICGTCGEDFYRLPGDSNPNMFCSKRCQLIHIGSKKRVFTEEIFEKMLKELNIIHTIQYQYDRYFADFYLPNLKLLLELDGRTFHSTDAAIEKDLLKSKIAVFLGYNMVRIWCSRSKEVFKLREAVNKLSGDDLAEFISAIPKGMINSVNLTIGCGVNNTANGENLTMGNAVPSLEKNFFEGVETKIESKGENLPMTIKYLKSAGHC